jgi:hypothetical protein
MATLWSWCFPLLQCDGDRTRSQVVQTHSRRTSVPVLLIGTVQWGPTTRRIRENASDQSVGDRLGLDDQVSGDQLQQPWLLPVHVVVVRGGEDGGGGGGGDVDGRTKMGKTHALHCTALHCTLENATSVVRSSSREKRPLAPCSVERGRPGSHTAGGGK